MTREEKIAILVQEIRDQEAEIRQLLRTSTQNANFAVVVLALVGAYLSTRVSTSVFCILPVFLNIAGLSHANAAIDVAHFAEIRNWLHDWANRELGADVFQSGRLSDYRKFSATGIAVNSLAGLVVVGSWVIGLIVAYDKAWFAFQVAGTLVLVGLSGWSLYDYVTIRKRTRSGLTQTFTF